MGKETYMIQSCDHSQGIGSLIFCIVVRRYDTYWEITGSEYVYASGGNSPHYGNSQTYNKEICLPAGCYTFTLYDDYGDG
jgi:hypothetical protein